MGQKPSRYAGGGTNASTRPKLPITSWWVLRGRHRHRRNPNPEQPIRFQYKTRRKGGGGGAGGGERDPPEASRPRAPLDGARSPPPRAKSEPSLVPERSREKHRHRRKSAREAGAGGARHQRREAGKAERFGYEIRDVGGFLTRATIEKPANIPVVLALPTVLYQTRAGGHQAEIRLPLGMVVNAVFKNQAWLYVQTPHAEEGYVGYAACLPLGIIPPPDDDGSPVPCWEKSTDVFPKPSGNMTDTEKLSSRSECSGGRCRSARSRGALSACGERSVDRLYLQAAACAKVRGTRQTLLVVCCDYEGGRENTLSVFKGDVVVLVSGHLRGWFWVRNRHGFEGFIPAVVAGHGFL